MNIPESPSSAEYLEHGIFNVPLSLYMMGKGELRVYVCRDPQHSELVNVLREMLNRVKPKDRPKLKVVKLKLTNPADFPAYLEYLEELFGGIATAEYRRFGIKALPAVVYRGKLVVQGRVPTREELEELLQYEGLKVKRELVPTREQPPRIAAPQPARRVEERVERGAPRTTRPPSPIHKPEAPPGIAASLTPPIEVEELSIEEAREPRLPKPSISMAVSQSRSKTCLRCIFYERESGRCLLLRVSVPDPQRPPCIQE